MVDMKMSKKWSWLRLIGLMLIITLGCVTPFGDRPPFPTPIVELPTPPELTPMVEFPTPTGPMATQATGFSGELALMGIYDPQDQSAAARQFQQRLSEFEQETGIKVNYDWASEDIVTELVQTYLAAGQPLDLAPVRPEKVADLAEIEALLEFDNVGLGQLASPYLGDSACRVDGKRYCAIDQNGLAWIIPKNAPNPFGSTKLLPLLVK
jgi:ABC-type glycerol-3-phosphate transport system substrate-binding protein